MAAINAQILKTVSKMIMELPEKDVAAVCKTLKLTEQTAFKDFAKAHCMKGSLYRDFIISCFSGPSGNLAKIYNSIEGVLFVGGCAPGIGIAFNLIDFCFCLALGNYLGAFVALVSCFPIPGFKLAGKGLEKLIMNLLKRIKPTELFKFVGKLGKRLGKIGFHNDKSYAVIRKNLENLVEGLNNPFAEEVVKTLNSILKRFPTTTKDISKAVCKTGDDLFSNLSVKPRSVTNYSILKP